MTAAPMDAGAPAVEVVGVSKLFADGGRAVHALDDVSLRVERGELLAVTGASGSGKSTLLHLMGGLDAPTRGEIRLEGRPLARLGDGELTLLRRRRIGFVFQFFNLLPTLTAEENVAVPLLLDGVAPRTIRARVRCLLALVGLEDRRDHRPSALSGGEMQRVALARALVTAPALVLADEPTGNLDAASAEAVLALLAGIGRRLGQTTVLVTHDARAAARADRIVTLVRGRVVGGAAEPADARPARACDRTSAAAPSDMTS